MQQGPLMIGTRGSPLALYQARLVQSLLGEQAGLSPHEFEAHYPIRVFRTTGDKIKGDLKEFGGKGLFTKELEDALLTGQIAMAVHSMKDVPTDSQKGLMIGAILPREDPRDAFISNKVSCLADLPQGAFVGTASIRRRAQLSAKRPDVEFVLLRGNVGTRLQRLKDGFCDATFLACAGLRRLGQADVITETIEPDIMLPAPAQGAIGIEVRENDQLTRDAVAQLSDYPSEMAITAERAFLKALDGSCKTPIAALATLDGHNLIFRGEAVAKDGSVVFTRQTVSITTDLAEAHALGLALGQSIREEAGNRIVWDD